MMTMMNDDDDDDNNEDDDDDDGLPNKLITNPRSQVCGWIKLRALVQYHHHC